jgi:hypothetical protein
VIRGFSINNSHTHKVWSYEEHKAECCDIVISLIEGWFDIVKELAQELVWWQWRQFALLLCSSSCIEFLLLMRVFDKAHRFSWSVFLQCCGFHTYSSQIGVRTGLWQCEVWQCTGYLMIEWDHISWLMSRLTLKSLHMQRSSSYMSSHLACLVTWTTFIFTLTIASLECRFFDAFIELRYCETIIALCSWEWILLFVVIKPIQA